MLWARLAGETVSDRDVCAPPGRPVNDMIGISICSGGGGEVR